MGKARSILDMLRAFEMPGNGAGNGFCAHQPGVSVSFTIGSSNQNVVPTFRVLRTP